MYTIINLKYQKLLEILKLTTSTMTIHSFKNIM